MFQQFDTVANSSEEVAQAEALRERTAQDGMHTERRCSDVQKPKEEIFRSFWEEMHRQMDQTGNRISRRCKQRSALHWPQDVLKISDDHH